MIGKLFKLYAREDKALVLTGPERQNLLQLLNLLVKVSVTSTHSVTRGLPEDGFQSSK